MKHMTQIILTIMAVTCSCLWASGLVKTLMVQIPNMGSVASDFKYETWKPKWALAVDVLSVPADSDREVKTSIKAVFLTHKSDKTSTWHPSCSSTWKLEL
jgi:hypothetical protein